MKYIKYLSLIVILGVLIVSCEKDDSTVIDPTLTFPKILSASITPNVFDTSIVNAVAVAEVTSEEPVTKVTVTVKNPLGAETIYELRDDGVPPDLAAGDGKYSGYISFSMSCRLVGLYQGSFVARNKSGLYSSTINVPFNVINSQNVKPVLSNLISPDSLQKPSGVGTDTMRMAFLQVQVTDPNGLCDIKEAFFNSFKPPFGEPSLGNPFTMYDDGNVLPPHCDTIAGDGKYSLCIYIFWNATIGNYTFKYNARDRSVPGLLSDTLFHSIYVYP